MTRIKEHFLKKHIFPTTMITLVLGMIGAVIPLSYYVDRNKNKVELDQPAGNIEVIAGETHGWISVINKNTRKPIAINLRNIQTFLPKGKKETEIWLIDSGKLETETPYTTVWKKIAQASRK